MARGDRHNEIELNLLEGGRLVYLMGGRKVIVPAGRLTVFWAGVSHQIVDFESLTEYFVLTVPLAWFLQWGLPDDFTQPILHGETSSNRTRTAWRRTGHGSDSGARRAGWLGGTPTREPAGGRGPLAAAGVERGRERAATLAAELAPVLDQRHSSRAERMACFIAQNYTQPLTAETIGQHVGLHPNYAMSLFQRTFGTTLMRYVTQQRLSTAQRLLLTTRESITTSRSVWGSARSAASTRRSGNPLAARRGIPQIALIKLIIS